MGDPRLRILRAAGYIEQHLDRPLELAEVARHAGLSLYHFHRTRPCTADGGARTRASAAPSTARRAITS